jgi:hypothetical protein
MAAPTGGFTRPGSEGRMSREERDAFLALPLLCRLACLDPRGWPYVVPVWYEWDGAGFWIIPRALGVGGSPRRRSPRGPEHRR